MSIKVKGSSIVMNVTPSEAALVALANAVAANAEAIKAIAERLQPHGPVYGMYFETQPNETDQ